MKKETQKEKNKIEYVKSGYKAYLDNLAKFRNLLNK